MKMAEKIRILLVKRDNISEAELARKLGTTPQNLHNKLARDNFSQQDLEEIATVLNCTYKSSFVLNDTGDEV